MSMTTSWRRRPTTRAAISGNWSRSARSRSPATVSVVVVEDVEISIMGTLSGGGRCAPNSGPGRRHDCSRAPRASHAVGDTVRMSHENLLDGPAPTLLPADGPDADARAALSSGSTPREAVAAAPAASLLWALLAENALADDGDPVAAYAYARTGYHRGPRRAAPRGLARPRPDPRGPRAQPGVPAVAARARGGRGGHRRVRGGRALRDVPRRQRRPPSTRSRTCGDMTIS